MPSQEFGNSAVLTRCSVCRKEWVAKPRRPISIDTIPIAANEFICYNLMGLLKSKGIKITIPSYKLIPASRSIASRSPITHGVFAMTYYGTHSRITRASSHAEGTIYPDWLYWFDKWIGRIDSAGDSNLLQVGKKAVPIDFSMCFHWTCGHQTNIKPVDHMEVITLPAIEKYKSEKSREAIRSLTDDELWDCITNNIPPAFITNCTLIAIWSGLCARRDLL